MICDGWLPAWRTFVATLRGRDYEPEATLLPRLLAPESVSVHVDASNGRHTYLMAKTSARGHVYAFEPCGYTGSAT
jgi:hypothetical protein